MEKAKVLFVDDDINILSSLKRGLMDENYKAFFATSGEKALAIMEENEISVIVTDMRMPGMDGLKLLKIIKEKYPGTIKIVLSGYTQLPQILATINQVEIFKFITKPWDLEEELKPIIRQAVEYYIYLQEKEKQKEVLEQRNVLYQNILKATDEKLSQSKDDFENIREISKYILNAVKVQAGCYENREILNNILLMEELYLEYLNLLPTSIEYFETEKFEADLNKWLSKQKLDDWVDIKRENDTLLKLRGNYILIYYIVTTLIKQFLPYSEEKGLNLTINLKKDDLVIFITINRIDKCFLNVFRESIITDILTSFMNEVCKTIDGTLIFNKYDEHPSVELKIPVKFV